MKKIVILFTFGLMVNFSLQAASPLRPDTVSGKSGIGLRNSYILPPTSAQSRPAVPNPGSIYVDRDPVVHNYKPEDLVKKVLLSSHTPEDLNRIQNIRHVGWNWNGSSWNQVALPPNPQAVTGSVMPFNRHLWGLVGHTNITYDPNERSLLYYHKGGADPTIFDLDSGLLLTSGPGLMAEGPNQGHHSLSDGFRNDGTQGAHLFNNRRVFTNPPLANSQKHKPGTTWNSSLSFDRDLDGLSSDPFIYSTCGSVLEFDFQPAAGLATFDYIFASDEYPEGVYNTNDVFGFFVSGPYDTPPGHDIEGTIAIPSLTNPKSLSENTRGGNDSVYYRYNIARLPDNNPVGINYINWGADSLLYDKYTTYPPGGEFLSDGLEANRYINMDTVINGRKLYDRLITGDTLDVWTQNYLKRIYKFNSKQNGGSYQLQNPHGQFYGIPTNPHLFRYTYQGDPTMEYDGYTVKLKAKADKLIPGKWYHLKLAVSNTVQLEDKATKKYVVDMNHGSGVFLANLDLGAVDGDINSPYMYDPAFDIKGFDADGNQFLYEGCDKYIMTLNFDATAANMYSQVTLKYINLDGDALLALDGTRLFPKADTLMLSPGDTTRTYPFKLSTGYKGWTDGQHIGVIIKMSFGGSTDTVLYSPLYKHASYSTIYKKPTLGYAGRLSMTIENGSPELHRSLDKGESWEKASLPFTKSQIANIGDEERTFILMREPKTCYPIDTIWLGENIGYPIIQRPIHIPEIPGVTILPYAEAGMHYVESRRDFEFTIFPDESNAGMVLHVSTGREYPKQDEVGLVVTKNEDGSYTVLIKQVQEPINVSISFTTGNSVIESGNVWTNGNKLYITGNTGDAKIYTAAGALYKSLVLVEGETSITSLPVGFYVVTMNDGKSYKIAIK